MSFDNLPPGTPGPGEMLAGKYLIERVLGAGGMGVVLAARHVELGQPVAVKFLNAQLSGNPEIVTRFLREARAAAAIRSEHVARVHDVTRTEAGVPYIVMEHLEGCDLEQLVRARGPLPVGEAVDYLLQAGKAIAEAHAAKIVHRDLKPGNLFLTHRADGSPLVKVLDFGMSKITQGDGAPLLEGSLTAPATMLGSPWYMSPEQIRSSKHVDHRSDVWSLGIVLYKLLTGSQAFEAESLSSCLVKIVTEAPLTLRARRPDAPAELEAVILRCLEKDVNRRLQNVAELAWALLPFAPEGSRVSAERIVRVLLGSDVLTERTLPLSAAAAAPFRVAPPGDAPPRSPAIPSTADVASTAASVTSTRLPSPRPTPRWPFALIGAIALLAGTGLVMVRAFAPRAEAGHAASTAPSPSAAPAATAPRAMVVPAQLPIAPPPQPPFTAIASAAVAPESPSSALVAPKRAASVSGADAALIRANPFGAEDPKPAPRPLPPAATRPPAVNHVAPSHPGVL